MDENHIKNMKYHNLKNKLIYFVCFGSMLAILGSVFYICFFRDMHIDLTKNVQITFTGENGNGRISMQRHDMNYNQRIQPFYDALVPIYDKDGNLSNGDEVTITFQYDPELAEEYHIIVDANQLTLTVEGLAQRFASKEEIPDEYLTLIEQKSKDYMSKDADRILHQDFTITSDVVLKSETRIQRVFLRADDTQEHDKIIDVYQMTAAGKREDGTVQEETIYYMVVIDDVNSNMIVNDDQIYGEKTLFTEEDLTTETGIIRYFRNKYVLSYEIEVF